MTRAPSLLRLLPLLALLAVAACDGETDPGDPGDGSIDITDALLTDRTASCAAYAAAYTAQATDVQRGVTFDAALAVSADGSECTFASNAVPNHDFNATGSFATPMSEQAQSYTVTATPTAAARPTALSLQYDNAVFLNGVKLDLLAAGCFGVGNGNIGCNDPDAPYRYDPLGTATRFGADEHNAHTQPDGTYHYHGNPKALFDETDPSEPSPVIGFAADGFPIFGSYISDGGTIRAAESSYRLTRQVLRLMADRGQPCLILTKSPAVLEDLVLLERIHERSLAVAQLLRTAGDIPVKRIDMDLNSDERFASNKLHAAAIGYIRSHGYEPHTKPDMLIASWAANVLCNGSSRR